MTRKLCAVGMRNAILRNHLKREGHLFLCMNLLNCRCCVGSGHPLFVTSDAQECFKKYGTTKKIFHICFPSFLNSCINSVLWLFNGPAERDDELKKAGCFHSKNHHLLQDRTCIHTCFNNIVLAFLISIE